MVTLQKKQQLYYATKWHNKNQRTSKYARDSKTTNHFE